jgi:hypothetical protein
MGYLTTLHQLRKLLGVRLSLVRYCAPKKKVALAASDRSSPDPHMNQYADLLSRAEIPVCACPVHPECDKQKCGSWIKFRGYQINILNSVQQQKRNHKLRQVRTHKYLPKYVSCQRQQLTESAIWKHG